jgi:hypothetical protein
MALSNMIRDATRNIDNTPLINRESMKHITICAESEIHITSQKIILFTAKGGTDVDILLNRIRVLEKNLEQARKIICHTMNFNLDPNLPETVDAWDVIEDSLNIKDMTKEF